MKLKVRHAVVDDAPHLPSIERSSGERFRALAELAWIADDAVQSEERHVALIENGAAWVAIDGTDTLIGFLNGDIIDDHLHIFEFAVRFDCQRRGVGGALFEQAKHFAIQRKLKGMTLTTFREIAPHPDLAQAPPLIRLRHLLPARCGGEGSRGEVHFERTRVNYSSTAHTSPPWGWKRSKRIHLPSGDQTG